MIMCSQMKWQNVSRNCLLQGAIQIFDNKKKLSKTRKTSIRIATFACLHDTKQNALRFRLGVVHQQDL